MGDLKLFGKECKTCKLYGHCSDIVKVKSVPCEAYKPFHCCETCSDDAVKLCHYPNGHFSISTLKDCDIWQPRPDIKPLEKERERGASLRKGLSLINGDRFDQYGAPEDSFAIIGEFWEVYDKYRRKLKPGPDSPKDVALKMVLLKIARTLGQEDKPDNYDDGCGYMGIAGDIVRKGKS